MTSAPPAAAAPAPTQIRHLVVALTTVMAFLLYLDRFCLSFAERYIKQDLGLDNDQIGWLFGAFFFAYALGQVPAGWLSDRFGARQMLTLYILLWSLFTGWMGLAMSFAAFLALRVGCGLGQAGAYPTGATIISKWVVFERRGLASGILSVGGRLGGVAAPILTAYLIIACVPSATPLTLGATDILDERGIVLALENPGKGGPGELRRILARRLYEHSSTSRTLVDTEELCVGLNRLLAEPALFSAVNLDDVPIEAEGRRLALIPSGERSAEQTLRLNRFLVEAAFPEQIRKYYGAGWRPVMIFYGLAGLLVAAVFWLGIRNRPRDHPLCNAAEVELIDTSRPAGTPDPHGKVGAMPIAALVTNFSLWLSSAVQFFGNFGWTFLLTWLPRYLLEVHEVPVVERGWMSGFPIFAGMFGMFAGGLITDWAAQRFGLRLGRMLPVAITRFVAAAAFFSCLYLKTPWPVTIAMAVVAVATDLGTASGWAFCQDVGGRHSGSVLGWGNMWGNFGSAVSPIILNWVAASPYGWNGVFTTCGCAFVVAGVLSFGIDATSPLMPAESEVHA